MNILIWCSGELKDFPLATVSWGTAIWANRCANFCARWTCHGDYRSQTWGLDFQWNFSFYCWEWAEKIGYQLWCFIYSLIMRGYNLQESELIHSSWCNLHLSIGYCLVNHHRMLWILDPIFWTSSQRPGFCMVSVWSLCVGPIILYQDVGISTRWCIFADPMTKSLPSGWI